MQREGFRWIYLVLDYYPPVGPCRAEALNHTLPALAEKLRAVNISLLGWGQRRGSQGTRLRREDQHLLRNDPGYRWKFSLHPALWSTDKLLELLEIRLRQFDPEIARRGISSGTAMRQTGRWALTCSLELTGLTGTAWLWDCDARTLW